MEIILLTALINREVYSTLLCTGLIIVKYIHMHSKEFVNDIKVILSIARQKTYNSINTAMVDAYWQIGKRILEEEQHGERRAVYGKKLLKELAKELRSEFGRGFDERELRRMRQFYMTFSIRGMLRPELSWSHYRILIRIGLEQERQYYLNEAAEQMWSYRTLDRNVSTLYYQRLLASQTGKELVKQEMEQKTKNLQENPQEFIKNPYVLEFLNLPPNTAYKEATLEQALLNNLQQFLLELGKGFAFVARQKLVRTETSDFYIDLVFYNYILKCFVLVDLKTTRISHQDIGQMDMYVRMYDDLLKAKEDNPTLGIVLCTETDKDVAKYSILNGNEQLFASKYRLYLPTEDELRAEIEREKELLNFHTNS